MSPPVELSDFSAHRGAEEGRNEKKYPTNEGGVRMSAEGLAESGKPTVEKKEARRSSRREYLCLAAGLAVGAGATYLAMPKPPEETFSGKGATKVKITVLRTFGMNEVHPKGLPVKPKYTGSCEVFTEGQEFIVDAKRPQNPWGGGLTGCAYAWEAMFPSAWRYYEAGFFDQWYENPKVGVMPCPDGLRPVIFKLEWI